MTAQEFTDNWIKENGLPIHTNTRLLEKTIAKIVESYHQKQVESVDLDSVVGRSEQLVCDCGDSDMTWYGNENDKKWFCFRCKKEAN